MDDYRGLQGIFCKKSGLISVGQLPFIYAIISAAGGKIVIAVDSGFEKEGF